MAIDFTNAAGQNITFTNTVGALSVKSIAFWINLDSFGDTAVQGSMITRSDSTKWEVRIATGTERIIFVNGFSTTAGSWATPNNSLTTGLHHITVIYDAGNVANNPTIYIDGVSQSLTELTTPVGTFTSDANIELVIGGYGSTKSLDGRVHKLIVYSDALSLAEVLSIVNSRGKVYPRDSIAFMPNLRGAAGLSTFSGALAAGNTIYDPFSNTYGVPAGSPVAVADNVLGW
jgi:hypothetical protein